MQFSDEVFNGGEGVTALEGSWLSRFNYNTVDTKNRKWAEDIETHITSTMRKTIQKVSS